MPKSPPCWPLKTLQNNLDNQGNPDRLDNFKICDSQIFMVDIFDGHIDVAIITGIDDMGIEACKNYQIFI